MYIREAETRDNLKPSDIAPTTGNQAIPTTPPVTVATVIDQLFMY